MGVFRFPYCSFCSSSRPPSGPTRSPEPSPPPQAAAHTILQVMAHRTDLVTSVRATLVMEGDASPSFLEWMQRRATAGDGAAAAPVAPVRPALRRRTASSNCAISPAPAYHIRVRNAPGRWPNSGQGTFPGGSPRSANGGPPETMWQSGMFDGKVFYQCPYPGSQGAYAGPIPEYAARPFTGYGLIGDFKYQFVAMPTEYLEKQCTARLLGQAAWEGQACEVTVSKESQPKLAFTRAVGLSEARLRRSPPRDGDRRSGREDGVLRGPDRLRLPARS